MVDNELFTRYNDLEWYGVYDFLECYPNGLLDAIIKVSKDSVLYSDSGWVRDLLRVCFNDINTMMENINRIPIDKRFCLHNIR